MKSFPKPLTTKEEKECLKRAEQGEQEAKDMLVEHNLRLVAHVVKKYQGCDYDMEDLLSVGAIGLIKAVNTFNADKGSRLDTSFENLRLDRRSMSISFSTHRAA